MHRLRRLRTGMPRVGHLRARRSAGKVGLIHGTQRGLLQEIGSPGRPADAREYPKSEHRQPSISLYVIPTKWDGLRPTGT